MDDDYDLELTPEERAERSRVVQRATVVAYVWHFAPRGSIWDRLRLHRRPEWCVLH